MVEGPSPGSRGFLGATTYIAKNPAGSASVIALLAGVVMLLLPFPSGWREELAALGSSVAGAAVFSFIYQFWANEALLQAIREASVKAREDDRRQFHADVAVALDRALKTMETHMRELADIHKTHWPTRVFAAGSEPNSEFNDQLNQALSGASRYDFRGQSGKHLSSRLYNQSFPRLQVVRAIIEDFSVAEVMATRITERRISDPRLYAVPEPELCHQIREDMLDAILGLYLARSRFEYIEVVLTPRPTDVRIELVEGHLFLSPFVRGRPQGRKYPEVYLYDHDSLLARITANEFVREFAILSRIMSPLRFDASLTSDELRARLAGMGWNLTAMELDERVESARRALTSLGGAMEGRHPGQTPRSVEADPTSETPPDHDIG